ncbi:MAG: GalNAc-alpha-(1-_4)-GalNAc-alpha-(1-_3)-diNAcBac-PP-undecaprenol [Actinomycetota bacterium]|nr:GalNAc-alpha-(1->4)-GalNAc-alpha-(1->3)-diNAcBac-PP-undecaprenol [Actinomycetota bacterium]
MVERSADVDPALDPALDPLPPPIDVLLVCAGMGAGGTQRVVVNLATAWSERGRRVVVATFFDRSPDFYHLPPTIPRRQMQASPIAPIARPARDGLVRSAATAIHRLPAPAQRALLGRRAASALTVGLGRLARVRWLRATITELRPATVIGFGPSANISALLAARGLPCRVVISERNDLDRQVVNFPVDTLRAHLYRTADAVTANSHGTLAALRPWVPAERLRFAPNPLRVPDGARTGPPPAGLSLPCVLTVGRLVAQKDHAALLDAFARLPPELDQWRLAVVGTGVLEGSLRTRADELGLARRVDWFGRTDDPYSFYRHAAVFALPSRYEGMPNALLEAMSFGVAPIVSDASPGPLEVVRHGETGLVVPTGDAGALAAAITRLATDPELRRTLGDAARREVARFETEAMAVWDDAADLRGATRR